VTAALEGAALRLIECGDEEWVVAQLDRSNLSMLVPTHDGERTVGQTIRVARVEPVAAVILLGHIANPVEASDERGGVEHDPA
jgi:hypothetical protein